MNVLFGLLLSGGGMKLSYQIGQLAALCEGGIRPSKAVCVSSGIVSAGLLCAYLNNSIDIRSEYRNYLKEVSANGKLPGIRQTRRAASEKANDLLKSSSNLASEVKLLAVGANRDSYKKELIDLTQENSVEVIEALMSIPLIFDSEASKKNRLIDGGYIANLPTERMDDITVKLALSHFPPKPYRHKDYDSFIPTRLQSELVGWTYFTRSIWAFLNSTFPCFVYHHEHDITLFPSNQHPLHFFSKNLKKHYLAIDRGYIDTIIELKLWKEKFLEN